MGADYNAGHGEGGQPPPSFSTKVTWYLPVYDPQTIKEHLIAVKQDFGLPYHDYTRASRRYKRSAVGIGSEPNSYKIDYYFKDPQDAVMFSLKYVK